MNSELPERYHLALSSLDTDVDMLRLARMLVSACEEAMEDGKVPEEDAAVALLSGRVGFASPVDTMDRVEWEQLVRTCQQGSGTVKLKPTEIQ